MSATRRMHLAPPDQAHARLVHQVEVVDLSPCSSDLIGHLIKEGEESHRKEYRAIVW